MNTDKIPQFGEEVSGKEYVLRLGGYGVIRNDKRLAAVVITPGGTFLPGGAQEQGESPEAALVREAGEECGLLIRVTGLIGIADELVYADTEGTYFRKRGTFFAAEVHGHTQATEPDYKLLWLSPTEALSRLSHGSQRWAVGLA
ncbi:MAG: NUDIX hydrolase [Verrucomicrobia bacterium]|nr:MAG: NUDIX hydrolase [Verrucomicrobiota bacterium]